MKRFVSTLMIVALLSNFIFTSKISQANASDDLPPLKGLFFDFGGGGDGLSGALGFKYSFASLSIGVVGFTNDIPNYSQVPPTGIYFNANEPLPSGYEAEKHTGIIVCFDAGFHYEYYPWTFFGTVGYYTQQDSVLAKEVRNDGRKPSRYSYKVENSQGVSFGGGANYAITDNVSLGLGLHTKRGVYAQFTYVWE